ncbi:polysaccharide deacetylase [Helicobacter cinaedi PAGU611]|uniref:Polysaccharide deacetylase n=1 Tax=Helicobacter cinaedi CCUG 18818 = ATCC BAA-847 TaxID=537971 RepID=A0AAI8MIJ1_9HELI|nr:polysaccharide deacetylase family protein [Helicobacter cinaedi]AWK61880.1 chitin deacetylase [Helicobacter cinaedi]EFR46672.1 polysaccharide deacetylase [Helicobacter cinaedi CCUG 18818 = ATCC BAA-847]QOQ91780.1 polysaccharide deacetylase family protein [Helicobacter cinaedi]QOQ95981.1 polysaccharide deacetylase family protein [Helicobacter cinaedi]BAM12308.1 polysaccharide deacetylase [Helicobacter cinaedi PAGU611]
MNCIPILRYTHIRDMQDSHSVSLAVFEKQIQYLQKKSYTFLSLDDMIAIKQGQMELPQKCVLLTFDGAWRDIYQNAYEILKHHWVKAGLFVVTEWIDESSKQKQEYQPIPHSECKNTLLHSPRSVMCNWEEVREMQDVFSIGSMTHTYQFSNVVSVSWHDDFELSKRLIKERLGVDTKHLAWPDGNYNQGLLRTAKSMGYEAFYTMQGGLNQVGESNDALKRFDVKDNLFWFKKVLFATSSTRNFRIGKLLL